MTRADALVNALNARKNRVLRIAEAALPGNQFRAFRGLFLDEFGREGLERDMERILADSSKVRNGEGQADTCKKGGAS